MHKDEVVRAAEVPPAPRLVEHEQQLQGPRRALGREERVAAVPQRGERRVDGRVLGRAARRRRRGRPTERARVADEHGGPPVGAAGRERRAVDVAFPRVVDVDGIDNFIRTPRDAPVRAADAVARAVRGDHDAGAAAAERQRLVEFESSYLVESCVDVVQGEQFLRRRSSFRRPEPAPGLVERERAVFYGWRRRKDGRREAVAGLGRGQRADVAQLRVREEDQVDRRRDGGDFVAEVLEIYITSAVQ